MGTYTKLFICLLALMVLSSSCRIHRSIDDIKRADDMLFSRPDSSLAIIRQIDTCDLKGKKWKSRYALIKAIALDRNYIDTTDSRFLSNAVRYYEKHGSSEEKMKAYYYLGRIQFNAGDYESAIVSFENALKQSRNSNDLRLKGMIYMAIGDTHNNNHNNNEELKNEQLAYDCFREYGDSIYMDYARFHLALAYHNNRMLDSAQRLLEQIHSHEDLKKKALIALAESEIHKDNPDADKIINWLETAMDEGACFELHTYYRYAHALMLAGKEKDADNILRQLSNYPDNVKTVYTKYQIAKLKGDSQKALEYFESYSNHSDSVVVKRLEQSLFKSKAAHSELLSDIYERKAKESRMALAIALLSSVLAIVLLLSVFQKRADRIQAEKELFAQQRDEAARMLDRIKEQEEREKLESDKRLKGVSDSYEQKMTALRAEYAKLYKSQFADIVYLLDKRYDMERFSAEAKKKYYERYKDVIAAVHNPSSGQKKFEKKLDEDLNGIMTKLRTDFPEFSKEQFRFASCVIAGFDSSSLSILFNGTKNNMNVRKFRMKDRILSKETPNKDLYAAFLR